VLHWEYDCFSYDEAIQRKAQAEAIILDTDFDMKAEEVWARRNEWYHLDFFKQSDWKCNLFGIIPERWKMVVW
jgi:hypothetical protein